MPRRRDTEKDTQPYRNYPSITNAEHEELSKAGRTMKGRYVQSLSPQRGAELEASIDKRFRDRESRAKRTKAFSAVRSSHRSYRYTAAGKRAAYKRTPRK